MFKNAKKKCNLQSKMTRSQFAWRCGDGIKGLGFRVRVRVKPVAMGAANADGGDLHQNGPQKRRPLAGSIHGASPPIIRTIFVSYSVVFSRI